MAFSKSCRGRKSQAVKEMDRMIHDAFLNHTEQKNSKRQRNESVSDTSSSKLATPTQEGASPRASLCHGIEEKSSDSTMFCPNLEDQILIIQLSKLIPLAFGQTRSEIISTIVESIVGRNCYLKELLHEADLLPDESSIKVIAGVTPSDILWQVTKKIRKPVNRFFAPPVSHCTQCFSPLQCHHTPINIIAFTNAGPIPAQKISLRCKHCALHYHYDMYGGASFGGYKYYNEEQSFIAASNVILVEKELCESWISAGHHTWTSFEGAAEVYNETMRYTRNVNYTNLKECKGFLFEHIHEDSFGHSSYSELHRKTVANAFWAYQVERELRERNELDHVFVTKGEWDDYMTKVDIDRANSVYIHENCTADCKKRGCGSLWSIDGNWKLRYPICMYQPVKQTIAFSNNLSYVNSCPNSPHHGMAFCKEHVNVISQLGIPTKLKEFLAYKKECGIEEINATALSMSAADCQGISKVREYMDFGKTVDDTEEAGGTKTSCNKDTGEKITLQKWTRGTFFIVSGGGHIEMWQPLYKSEGPAQVFLIVLIWLITRFGSLDRHVWKRITVAYDNMCHLNNLKVARQALPLPGNLKHIWSDVNKVIDDLHIKNHRDPSCHVNYSTESIKKENPHLNTMSCEQTFAWLSRHKHIMCSMPKIHFHFYLHRMVKRRNTFISYCNSVGKRTTRDTVTTSLSSLESTSDHVL